MNPLTTTDMTVIKYLAIAALALVAIFGIFAEPHADDTSWVLTFWVNKLIALAAIGGIYLIKELSNKEES